MRAWLHNYSVAFYHARANGVRRAAVPTATVPLSSAPAATKAKWRSDGLRRWAGASLGNRSAELNARKDALMDLYLPYVDDISEEVCRRNKALERT